MKLYTFSLGNSNTGPIGFCIRVRANTRKEALEIVKVELTALAEGQDIPLLEKDKVDYLCVFFNPDHVTIKDIEEEQEEDLVHA